MCRRQGRGRAAGERQCLPGSAVAGDSPAVPWDPHYIEPLLRRSSLHTTGFRSLDRMKLSFFFHFMPQSFSLQSEESEEEH